MLILARNVFALGIVLTYQSAFAAGPRVCEAFTAFSPTDGREVYFTDVDLDGAVSVGDKRVGQRKLLDSAGAEIGKRYWTIAFREIGDKGEAVSRDEETVNVFDSGVIFTTYHIDKPNAMSDYTADVSIPQGSNVMTIVGGTGAFARASGTLVAEVAGNEIHIAFNVTCK